MTHWKTLLAASLATGFALWLAGCNPAAPPSSTNGSGSGATTDGHGDEHGHEGHDHAHEHAHHGPHEGELMAIGEEEYHLEWKYGDQGKVTFYVLDGAAKEEVPIAAEKIEVDVTIGENEPKTYELMAVNPSGDEMKTAQFEIGDEDFATGLKVLSSGKGGGKAVIKSLTIGDKPFENLEIKVEEHDHAH
ncbi:MAG TPA: hypothetical protein VFV87_22590 [Pirellulaceae bacterium]|nr:hypothetical protein [Pirellulaceae bacterium]